MTEGLQERIAPTILVVEDEPLLRMTLAEVLEDAGYTVAEADCVAKAVELVLARQISFDLVLSDIRMPGAMDGLQLADWIRERFPGIPVILTTGYSAKDAGVKYPLLTKPYDYRIVVEKIRELLG